MKFLIRCLFFFAVIIAMVVAHIVVSYLLPSPFNTLNSIFVILSLLLLTREGGSVVWMAFFGHFFIELYTITPFGVILASGTFSMLLVYWLFQYALTNRSWYTAMVMAGSAIVLYRFFFTLLLLITALVEDHGIAVGPLLRSYGWEFFFTVLMSGALYGLSAVYNRFAHPTPTIRWS